MSARYLLASLEADPGRLTKDDQVRTYRRVTSSHPQQCLVAEGWWLKDGVASLVVTLQHSSGDTGDAGVLRRRCVVEFGVFADKPVFHRPQHATGVQCSIFDGRGWLWQCSCRCLSRYNTLC